jgi:diguanylate cyclase (GGDEF)-like protein/PAS domain S-box-containing protein
MGANEKSLGIYLKDIKDLGLFDALGDPISIQDTNFRIRYQNQAAQDLIGNHVGKYCYQAYEQRDHVCEGCPVGMTFKDGGVYTKERSAPTDGGTIHVEITSSPLKDETGKIIAGIEVVRDITERKKMEELIVQAKKEWEDTFDIIDDAITIHDREFNITRANKASANLRGTSFSDIIGQKCHEYFHGADSPSKSCPGCQTLEKGESSITEMFEPILNKFFEIKTLPRYDKDNQLSGLIHCVKDITSRKKLEEELRSLSLKDDLTDLYNRRGFITLARQQLRVANRLRRGVLILYADMDNMKCINDTYGHKEGDAALIEMATILKEIFRESDIIARIGGDEFVVFPVEIMDTNPDAINKRIQKYIDNHNEKRNKDYALSLSMGIVHHEHKCLYSIEDLMSQADSLMYKQKQRKQES